MNRWDRALSALPASPFVLDVGAHDGYFQSAFWHGITHYGWAGLMIEPVQSYFDELVACYRDFPQVICHRAAIADAPNGETRVLVPPAGAPKWQQGSSTSETCALPKYATDAWKWEAVPTTTLPSVLALYDVRQIDAVNIDTEGMDAVVLLQLDLTRYRPAAIKMEVFKLSTDLLERVQKHLQAGGYSYEPLGEQDLVAWPTQTSGS